MEEKKPEEFEGLLVTFMGGDGVYALERVAFGEYKIGERLGDRIEDGKIVKEKPLE